MQKICLLFASIWFAFLFSCSEKSTPAPSNGDTRPKYFEGDLTRAVREIEAKSESDECSKKYFQAKMQVASELESRKLDLRDLNIKHSETKFPTFSFGSIKVADNRSARPSNVQDQWNTEIQSWKSVLENYERIKSLPLGIEWQALNVDVRSLIGEEQSRIVEYDNYAFQRTDGASVSALYRFLVRFKDDASLNIVLPPELQTFVASRPEMADNWNYFDSQRNPQKRKKAFEFLLWYVKNGLRHFEIRKISSQSFSNGELSIPFRGNGLSAEERSFFEAATVQEWGKADLKMNIKWVDLDDAFKIVLENLSGLRAYVMMGKQEMHLYNPTRATTITHEFGHVLGLPDEYYTHWSAQDCAYITEYNESRVMSDSARGKITPDLLNQLTRFHTENINLY